MFVSFQRWHSTLFHNAISLKLVVGRYGRSHYGVQWKKHPRSSPQTFFSLAYLLNSNYEKSAKCKSTFQRDNFFPILPKYWQISKYTAILSEFSFPKRENIKSKFWMVNLCNGGTRYFVKLSTSDHFFLSPKSKKAYLKQPLKNFIQRRNTKQT